MDDTSRLLFGAATSAFQIEGASTADGKGPSIWDAFCRIPGTVAHGDTGDVACDHVHRVVEDLDIMSELGLDAYRFSIAWPRVMPDGRALHARGFDFYDRLVDGLLARGIEPWPTLYHWDLPQALQDVGGWASRDTVERFGEFADAVADRLGDRVARVTTLNEPWCAAFLGHAAGVHAPGHRDPAESIVVAHHLLLAHGTAAIRWRERVAGGTVGITLNTSIFDPLRPDDPEDVDAARLIDGQMNRFFLDPLLRGRYPADIREALAPWWSPELDTADDLALIAQPLDFLGVNYYRGEVVSRLPATEAPPPPPTDRPAASPYPAADGIHFHTVLPERTSLGWAVQPEGLTRLLQRLSREYTAAAGVPLYVTENGAAFDDDVQEGAVQDDARVRFVRAHVAAVQAARERGVDVRGYFYWSLLDNFEWDWGYGQRFGIVRVEPGTLDRTIKASGRAYAALISAERERVDTP